MLHNASSSGLHRCRVAKGVLILCGMLVALPWVTFGQRPPCDASCLAERFRSGEPIAGLSFDYADLTSALRVIRSEGLHPDTVQIESCSVSGWVSLADLGEIRRATAEEQELLGLLDGETVSLVPALIVWDSELKGICTTMLDSLISTGLNLGEMEGWEVPFVIAQGAISIRDSQCEYVILHNGEFEGPVNIERCQIGELLIANCEFMGRFPPEREEHPLSRRYNGFSLSETSVLKKILLEESSFNGRCNMSNLSAQSGLKIEDTEFRGSVLLDQATFGGMLSILNCEFRSRLSTSGAKAYAGVSLGDLQIAYIHDETQLALAASMSWDSLGNGVLADMYYYEYRKAVRETRPAIQQALEWFFVDLTCAYGTSWKRLALTAFTVVVLYSVAFWLSGGLSRVGVPSETKGSLGQLRTAIYFSIVTFTTLGYGDYRPTGWRRHLASSLAVLGALQLALFIVVFSREFMR